MKNLVSIIAILTLTSTSCLIKKDFPNYTKQDSLNDKFFGNYQKPELLNRLEFLEDEGLRLEFDLHYFIDYDRHYSVTPIDVIPFAGTGSNGIHFGFLTDFGFIQNLNEAPIVVVCPSCDPTVRLVAKNLTDFVGITMTIGDATYLTDGFETDQEFRKTLVEYELWAAKNVYTSDTTDEQIEKEILQENISNRIQTVNILKDQLGIQPVENVCDYLRNIKKKRDRKIYAKDCHGLGIRANCPKSDFYEIAQKRMSVSEIDSLIKVSNRCQRIQIYRNATCTYILGKNYDVDVIDCLVKHLEDDGFLRESRILESEYK